MERSGLLNESNYKVCKLHDLKQKLKLFPTQFLFTATLKPF